MLNIGDFVLHAYADILLLHSVLYKQQTQSQISDTIIIKRSAVDPSHFDALILRHILLEEQVSSELFNFLSFVVLVVLCHFYVLVELLALDEAVVEGLDILDDPFLLENDLEHTNEEEEYHLPHQEQNVSRAAATPSGVVDLRHAPNVADSKSAN
jgi:hypothetical protein